MIYGWLHKDWKGFSGSLLFANNSYQNLEDQTPVDGTVQRQTFGTHLVAKPSKGLTVTANHDNGGTDGEIKSFFPIFGTNHKFNGYMDYFYVGNHANNVGLNDIYGKTVIKTGAKSKLLIAAHYFAGAESLGDGVDDYLGTEVDIVYSHKVLPFATLKCSLLMLWSS